MPPNDTPNDTELMERFGVGDDAAFQEIVRRYHRPLLNFFWRRCYDRDLAEDYTQEVFLRLVRHRGRWRPQAKFTTYLFRIAENYWIDRYRSRKAAPGMVSLATPVSDDGGELENSVSGVSREPGLGAADRERGQAIQEAVARLTKDQRAVFLLAETKGFKYAQIAERLGIPVGTVKSRMHAAVTRLRGMLRERLDDELR